MTRQASRQESLNTIEQQEFDLIVVGAGINGAGIARDASMRGLRVLLLDKGDVAGGTTSYSTRLIHGGLRYLEHGEIGLVRESLRERERLLRIAPHLVQPLRFLIPIYAESRRGPQLIRLGMFGYDLLSFDKSLPWHRMLSQSDSLGMEPGINAAGLRGSAYYTDGQVTFPERLALENALAARDYGATVLTYVKVEECLRANGAVTGVRLRDELHDATYTVHAPLTINVAGPWVDDVLGEIGSRRLIGGTKGTHIVVPAFPGAPDAALYVEAGTDQRPYFVIPWNQQYLIGTTDLRYDGDLDAVRPSEEEIRYLIDETNRVVPGANLSRDSVSYAYAGVRPLPATDGTNASGITRRHIIHDHAPEIDGLLSIIGGKITTYRHLAEESVDLCFRKLGRVAPRCATGDVALPGATGVDWSGFAATFHERAGLTPEITTRLLHLYGIFAWEIVRIGRKTPALLQPLGQGSGVLGAEVVFAFQRELAQTLADVMLRRTMIGLDADRGLGVIERVAQIAATHAGWDTSRTTVELQKYRTYVKNLSEIGPEITSRQ